MLDLNRFDFVISSISCSQAGKHGKHNGTVEHEEPGQLAGRHAAESGRKSQKVGAQP